MTAGLVTSTLRRVLRLARDEAAPHPLFTYPADVGLWNGLLRYAQLAEWDGQARRSLENNMEITKQHAGEFTELIVKGRLDAYWADHLTTALEEVIRGGAHYIRLNLADVAYISSIGIRVLLQFYKQLHRIHGVFSLMC